MLKMKVLVTGSGGLIGYETSRFFLEKGAEVIGVDNNMRAYFFGEKGDTSCNIDFLKSNYDKFENNSISIVDRGAVTRLFQDKGGFDLVVHTAAQPSHDWAAREPFTDFDVNANGTLNLLENFRLHSPKGVFIFTSTNKVYGDNPNDVNLVELDKRYDYFQEQVRSGVSNEGISEEMSLDHCTHSLFGASKVAADVLAQEYGKYFELDVGVFRGGCLTGPQHSAVELHGYLAYIVKCAKEGKPYRVFGYKGKQVRDQIHSFDVVNAFWNFYLNPKQGIAYNLGGTKENSVSILETVDLLKDKFGLTLNYSYENKNRVGDHICYYSDMGKFKKDYPDWKLTRSVEDIVAEMLSWDNL